MNSELKDLLENAQYRLTGKHSAVKVCHWTKESIRGNNHCYKQKFYGIQSHRCLQMTPCIDVCNHKCLFCWRPMEHTTNTEFPENETDNPEEVVDGLIQAQKKLLIGFKGFEQVDRKKLQEALEPKHAAISLAGEPTLYPKLGELIEEFHKRDMTTFLVTNGTKPEVLEKIPEPTQLYISVDAPNKELYRKIDRPSIENGWEKLQESLELLKNFSCNTVLRLTLLKMNMVTPKCYSELIEKFRPKFVECKAYMHVGFSKKRLPRNEMPLHSEVLNFAQELEKNSSYTIKDQKKDSRVVLLS